METQLLLGDCLEQLKNIKDNTIDSIVTDPPYGLSFMGKDWDKVKATQETKSQIVKGLGAGMKMTSHADNVEFGKWVAEWSAECLRVLKPGGYMLAFGGSRMYHRLACGVEDAGFEIRDQIMWVYGSGFPKSHNIGKAVDKIQGNDRTPDGTFTNQPSKGGHHAGNTARGVESNERYITENTKGNSEWEGWGTALKPAHEPIVMARKPFSGTVADNVLEWGTGGINIDGCRIGYSADDHVMKYKGYSNGEYKSEYEGGTSYTHGNQVQINPEGRFPANIIFDEEAGKILDEQSGDRKGMASQNCNNQKLYGGNAMNVSSTTRDGFKQGYNDNGGASRFFYCPKASKKDRDEGMPEKVGVFIQRPRREDGSVIYKETHPEEWAEVMSKKPRKEKTSLGAAEEILQEKKIKGRDEGQDNTNVPHKARPVGRANIHPTVKPTDLMAYLIRLVTPKGGVVLDPFTGSGSTGKAAVREGMNFIGIEREEEYFEIAKQRIEWEVSKKPNNKFWD